MCVELDCFILLAVISPSLFLEVSAFLFMIGDILSRLDRSLSLLQKLCSPRLPYLCASSIISAEGALALSIRAAKRGPQK